MLSMLLIAGCSMACGNDNKRALTPTASAVSAPISAGEREAAQPIWALETVSPEWVSAGPYGVRGCTGYERALTEVARLVAGRRAAGEPPLDMGEIALELRSRGSPHVWPRIWTHEAESSTPARIEQAFEAWLARFPAGTARRCGVARARARTGAHIVTIAMVEPLADLDRFPTTARSGQWLRFSARLGDAALAAKVVVLGPHGAPRTAPTRFEAGSARANFSLDQPGLWRAQLLLDTAAGPRPALEAWVFVDEAPRREAATGPAPGEAERALGSALPAWRRAVLEMMDGARASEQMPPLERDERLDALAQAHAEAMRQRGQAVHDAGAGSPRERVLAAAYPALGVGENVAQASSLARAHRILWNSPSHRGNLLDTSFDRVGVGIVAEPVDPAPDTLHDELREASGSTRVWVCQLFVDSAPVENTGSGRMSRHVRVGAPAPNHAAGWGARTE